MLIKKISSNIKYCSKNSFNIKALQSIFLNEIVVNKRNFSIENIGKRYENPYDYKNKPYGLMGQIFDSTLKKLGENSLIITVEGNFGSGKSSFAKKLAKEIDFIYAREPDLDIHLFELSNNHNKREIINEYVKENKRFHVDSLEEWHLSPTFKSTIQLQHNFYNIRWMQTRTALLHLLSTGQGVVLERSVFSDSVIGQALYESNLLSSHAYRFYLKDVIKSTLNELWKPHVSIYLEKSPEECLKTIKENGKPFEKNSKVYTIEFLDKIDKNYKKNFLKDMRNHLHILTYASKDANTERVIEDLEMLDYEDQHKFIDWRIRRETTINSYRKFYDNCIQLLESPNSYVDVPEYFWFGEDYNKLNDKLKEDSRLNAYTSSLFSPIIEKSEKRDWL